MPSFGEGIKGVADAKVALLTGDTAGSNIDIPGIKTFNVSVTGDTDEQRGDDQVLFIAQEAKTLDVEISAAQANAAALAVFTGGTVTTSGVTPNRIILYKESATPVVRYAQVSAQGSGRDATNSALRVVALKVQVTEGPTYDLSEGSWLEPTLSGRGVAKGGFLMEVSNYETEVAIA